MSLDPARIREAVDMMVGKPGWPVDEWDETIVEAARWAVDTIEGIDYKKVEDAIYEAAKDDLPGIGAVAAILARVAVDAALGLGDTDADS